MRTCTGYPQAAAPGGRSPCPTSLPRYERWGRSAPGCPPRFLPARGRGRACQHPSGRRGGGREGARPFAVPRHRPAINHKHVTGRAVLPRHGSPISCSRRRSMARPVPATEAMWHR